MSLTSCVKTIDIGFSNLRIQCLVGILPHEKLHPQEVCITLKVSLSQPVDVDALEATIDYTQLAAICAQSAQAYHRGLLEILARDLICALLAKFPLSAAWIRIEKPSALADADHVFVEYALRRATCVGL